MYLNEVFIVLHSTATTFMNNKAPMEVVKKRYYKEATDALHAYRAADPAELGGSVGLFAWSMVRGLRLCCAKNRTGPDDFETVYFHGSEPCVLPALFTSIAKCVAMAARIQSDQENPDAEA